MWMTIVMVCHSLQAESCQVIGNSKGVHFTLESCKKEYLEVEQYFMSQGMYHTKGGCFKVGKSA